MKKLYCLTILLLITTHVFPQVNAVEFFIESENNPITLKSAFTEAEELNLPKCIYLPEGIFIDLKGLINGKPAYAVMYDLLNPYNGLKVMTYDQITASFDISNARIVYTDGRIINESLGFPEPVNKRAASFLLFMESGIARVSALDPMTGDVINLNYLTDVTLSTPKQARLTPWGFISISDQILDCVNKYDTLGVFQGLFAPAGGVNTSILNNVRGHNYKDGFLFVTTADAGNPDCVAKFDSTGTYVGNFIANNAGGLDSPNDILFRMNDVLVTAFTSRAIHRYDLNGAYLNNFVTGPLYMQQIVEASNGDIVVADFGVGGGVRIYSAAGDSLALYNVITANRGVWKLGNGNYLTTNAAGLHELSSTGTLLRTIISGVSGQYISPYDLSIVPVELTSFSASVTGLNVSLKWSTATEINNSGFEIERSTNDISFKKIGFVNGAGNSAEINSYSFTDKNPGTGKYYYRLKQFDYNGAFSYSDVQSVEFALPTEFSVEQNYPNPFNPITNIKFSIPSDSWVKAEVFNAIGQKVADIQDGMMKAGIHTLSFESSKLNSGIYYYKISAGNSSSVKKMILMK